MKFRHVAFPFVRYYFQTLRNRNSLISQEIAAFIFYIIHNISVFLRFWEILEAREIVPAYFLKDLYKFTQTAKQSQLPTYPQTGLCTSSNII